jgi:Rho-binding antiterminator
MKNNQTSIDNSFREHLETLCAQKKYVGINYKTDINELLSVTAIIKNIAVKEDYEYAQLSNGEEIRLDKIVRADGKTSPDYPGYDYSYNCSL